MYDLYYVSMLVNVYIVMCMYTVMCTACCQNIEIVLHPTILSYI